MLHLIFWIVVGVLALSYFGISLKSIVDSPTGKENIAFAWQLIQDGWAHLMDWLTELVHAIVSSWPL